MTPSAASTPEPGPQRFWRPGDKPGAGRYQCTFCGHRIVLLRDDEALPLCPECHGTEFRRVHP